MARPRTVIGYMSLNFFTLPILTFTLDTPRLTQHVSESQVPECLCVGVLLVLRLANGGLLMLVNFWQTLYLLAVLVLCYHARIIFSLPG